MGKNEVGVRLIDEVKWLLWVGWRLEVVGVGEGVDNE